MENSFSKKSVLNFVREMVRSAVDLLYPRQCQVCGETTRCRRFSFLCDDCFDGVAWIEPPWCERCGLPFHGKIESPFQCPNCREMTFHFDKAVSVVRFRGAVRHAIHAFKYERQLYWLRALEGWLAVSQVEWPRAGRDSVLKRDGVDVIVPVPLYSLRERERGFNQAWLLVRALSREWGIPAARKALTRVRATETQTHLDRHERMANLHGAFVAGMPGAILGKQVLLVDDVLTTGSTANECSRVLRKAGATSVLVLTLARG